MATDLDLARARIAALEAALQALHGFTPDDNEWMRRADEAERFVEEMRITVECAQQAEYRMERRMEDAERARDDAVRELAMERKRMEIGVPAGTMSPPRGPSKSDAADALRYMMESRIMPITEETIKTVYGYDLAALLPGILTKDVGP